MKRRTFLGVLGGATAWPFAARPQPKLPIIGWLGSGSSIAGTQWACFQPAVARAWASPSLTDQYGPVALLRVRDGCLPIALPGGCL
jgi:hypothetical protein